MIGYQVDNETKPYNTAGPNVQAAFVKALQQKWGSLDKLNKAWGLDYWSNRVNRWEDFPSTTGTMNASVKNAFAEFQRGLVTEFSRGKRISYRKHARNDQFIRQNFDMGWLKRPAVSSPRSTIEAARPLDVAGMDIYHPTRDDLRGVEISLRR